MECIELSYRAPVEKSSIQTLSPKGDNVWCDLSVQGMNLDRLSFDDKVEFAKHLINHPKISEQLKLKTNGIRVIGSIAGQLFRRTW